ncbi:MAG: YdbH domain-containing protein [Halioglobus sp.]
MTPIRSVALLFCLLLILLAGGGLYVYQNLPTLLENTAKQYLPELGLQTVHYSGLTISHKQLSLNALALQGQYEDTAYAGSASDLVIRYNWRELLHREIESVTVQSLQLEATEIAQRVSVADASPLDLSKLFPPLNLSELPLNTLRVNHWDFGYQKIDLPLIEASGSLLVDQLLQIHIESSLEDVHVGAKIWTAQADALPQALVTLKDKDQQVAEFSLVLQEAGMDQWRWSVDGEVEYTPVLHLLRRGSQLPGVSLHVEIADGLNLAGKTQLSALIEHHDRLDWGKPLLPALMNQFDLQVSATNQIEQLDVPGIASKLITTLSLEIVLEAGELSVQLAPAALRGKLEAQALALSPSTLKSLQWEQTIPLNWASPEPITLRHLDNGSWALNLTDNKLLIGGGATELRLEQLNLQTRFDPSQPPQIEAKLNSRMNSRLRKNQLPPMQVSVNHNGSLTHSIFSLALLDIAESMELLLNGEANMLTGIGQYKAVFNSQDLAYASETVLPILRKLKLLDIGGDLSIATGSMRLISEVTSRSFNVDALSQHSQLTLGNLSGSYDEYRFEGGALTASWAGIDKWRTKVPVELGIEKLNVGFDILDTRMQISLPRATPIDQPSVKMETFSSSVFGGRLFLPKPYLWDFAAKSNEFTLRAEGWQLADMVALQQDQDVEAMGILEGSLPVTITDGRVIIEDGYLRALPPGGSIRYIANEASKALAASSPELKLALDLLNDFQYEVLSSEVNLDKGGNLLLGLSLTGKNPSQYEGRPINFNINLEQNLDPLLQSLRLSDKLVEQLKKRSK